LLSAANLAWLAKKGLTLSNHHAVTHPSQPNYAASIGGDYFGMNHDDEVNFPKNMSTVIDLLEERGITWAEYQEDMPSVGFLGNYPNPETGADMYVRKHNPAVQYLKNTKNELRMKNNKPLSHFYKDMKNGLLPQWMFITPNMTSDGHDTSVTTAGTWTRNFLEPLLDNKQFMDNTLVLVTFDENHTYTAHNKIMALLLGDALPKKYVGKTDHSYSNHYSQIATVEANWDLYTLGRFDVGANVFAPVAEKTGDKVRKYHQHGDHAPLSSMYFNLSYAGVENDITGDSDVPFPAPNVDLKHAGREVLPSIAKKWAGHKNTYYSTALETYDGLNPPPGYEV
jgi:acid phosphatase